MRGTLDIYGGNLASMTDKLIGDAFATVKAVYDKLADITYVAYNMQAVVTLATQVQSLTARVGELEAEVAALKAE